MGGLGSPQFLEGGHALCPSLCPGPRPSARREVCGQIHCSGGSLPFAMFCVCLSPCCPRRGKRGEGVPRPGRGNHGQVTRSLGTVLLLCSRCKAPSRSVSERTERCLARGCRVCGDLFGRVYGGRVRARICRSAKGCLDRHQWQDTGGCLPPPNCADGNYLQCARQTRARERSPLPPRVRDRQPLARATHGQRKNPPKLIGSVIHPALLFLRHCSFLPPDRGGPVSPVG